MNEKINFYYSAMKGGKTTRIFQLIHDLEENGKTVLLIKPKIDEKGNDCIINRQGQKRKVDILLESEERILSESYIDKIIESDYIIVDEVQFLTEQQITELWKINKKINIPINCFGLRTNFRGELFSGSKALLSLADEIIKMDTNSLCVCGEPAEFNARKINNKFTTSGDEVEIDQTNKNISYVPLCGKCYYEKVYTKIKKKL